MLNRIRRWLPILYGCLAAANLAAGGQAEHPPVLRMEDQPRQFLAPGNPDATVRSLQLPFSTITFAAQGQVIRSWTFTVFDSSGRIVSQESRLETRDRGFFGELFGIGPRPQVEVPQELTWDGQYHREGTPENGTLVPDGNYTYQISIVDSAGGRAQTPPFNATVKNAKIVVDYVRTSNLVFSPQGSRKTLLIEQSGSREHHWEGLFTDSKGTVVRRSIWENPSDVQLRDPTPPNFSWDGRDDQGRLVPDGPYTYQLMGFNRAGAQTSYRLPVAIEVSNQTGVVRLTADAAQFSPLAVGVPRSLTLVPELASAVPATRWELRIVESDRPDLIRWRASGAGGPPSKVTFPGQTTSGLPLPEGAYGAVLSVSFENGNAAESPVVPFHLVLTPPQATLTSSAPVFGGSGRAGVTVSFRGEAGLPWTLDVLDAVGKVRRSYSFGATGAAEMEFQGLDETGQVLPDGALKLRASARNSAGVPGEATLVVRKDSRAVPVAVEVSRPVVVPGKGSSGVVRITSVLRVVDSIVHTTLRVVNLRGQAVAERAVDAILPFWDWTGTDGDRQPVEDGDYLVQLEVSYANGAVARAEAPLRVDSHSLDNQSPSVNLHLANRVFAPQNVDGPQTLAIGLQAEAGGSPLTGWRLTVVDPRGRPFRHFQGTGAPPAQLIWDGRSDSGELVESGEEYGLDFGATDSAGRTGRKSDQVTVDILVDKLTDGRFKIVISSIQFAGYSSDLFKAPAPLSTKNAFVLQRLAVVLARLPEYRIVLEGYAVSEFSGDPAAQRREQVEELVPLSYDRAEEVKNALVLLGTGEARFQVRGYGALRPLVPDTDLENRWKNRRVEFYLEKP